MRRPLLNTTAILTAAGYATRWLPWSLSMPKEMLPVFVDGTAVPAIQYVFEQLYDMGFRKFVIVVRKYKEVIMQHFSRDDLYLAYLEKIGKAKEKSKIEDFYRKVEDSEIVFASAPPNGFGGAVLSAEKYVHTDFVYIAAPDVIIPDAYKHYHVPDEAHIVGSTGVVGYILVSKSPRPENYGVVIGDYRVQEIVEKPKEPKSDLVFLGYAMLHRKIFNYLREEKPDEKGEIQLTPAISRMVKEAEIKIVRVPQFFDIGNVEGYLDYLYPLALYAHIKNENNERKRRIC